MLPLNTAGAGRRSPVRDARFPSLQARNRRRRCRARGSPDAVRPPVPSRACRAGAPGERATARPGSELVGRLERLHVAELGPDERQHAVDRVDHVRGLRDVGWPDPVEPSGRRARQTAATPARYSARVGSALRARGRDEDHRDGDRRRSRSQRPRRAGCVGLSALASPALSSCAAVGALHRRPSAAPSGRLLRGPRGPRPQDARSARGTSPPRPRGPTRPSAMRPAPRSRRRRRQATATTASTLTPSHVAVSARRGRTAPRRRAAPAAGRGSPRGRRRSAARRRCRDA